SEAVDHALHEAGIAVVTATHVREVDNGKVIDMSGDVVVDAQRVVALPLLAAPSIRGVPHDGSGFIPVDEHGRVRDTSAMYAAGDGTTFAIKQGGIAAQQADAVARSIARQAGALVAAEPFR